MLRQALNPSPALQRAVAATWAFRARGEREAEDRFRRLHRQLHELGADENVKQLAARAAEDERRHADLCAGLASAYGLPTQTSAEHSVPVGSPGMSLADRTLAEIVSLCCVAETLSVASLGAIRDATRVDDVRGVVHLILKDEVDHARLGWAHLGAERKQGRGEFLSEWLPQMMAAGIPEDLFDLTNDVENPEALAFGQLSRAQRVEIFRSTFAEVIFPGFEALGVNTAKAREWLAAQGA